MTTQIGRNGGRCAAIHTNMPVARPTKAAQSEPDAEDKAALVGLNGGGYGSSAAS